MPAPKTWEEFLKGLVLVISKDSTNESYIRTEKRLREAGFTNIIQIDLPSIKESVYTIQVHWNRLFAGKQVNFDNKDTAFIDTVNYPNKQESAVAHFNAYKYILSNKYDFALIVEVAVMSFAIGYKHRLLRNENESNQKKVYVFVYLI